MTKESDTSIGNGLPRVAESELAGIIDIGPMDIIKMTKIDPKTGNALGQQTAKFCGMLQSGTGISIGQSVFIRSNPNPKYSPDKSSVVCRIDKLADGTYIIHTDSGSVYRLQNLSKPENKFKVMPTDQGPKRAVVKETKTFMDFFRKIFGQS